MAAAVPASALRDTAAAVNGIKPEPVESPSVSDSRGGAAAPALDSTADWTPHKRTKYLPEPFMRCAAGGPADL